MLCTSLLYDTMYSSTQTFVILVSTAGAGTLGMVLAMRKEPNASYEIRTHDLSLTKRAP